MIAWIDDDGGGDNQAQDDDEDLKSDPIAQIDMVVSFTFCPDTFSTFYSCDHLFHLLAMSPSHSLRSLVLVVADMIGTPNKRPAALLYDQRKRDARANKRIERGGKGDVEGRVDDVEKKIVASDR